MTTSIKTLRVAICMAAILVASFPSVAQPANTVEGFLLDEQGIYQSGYEGCGYDSTAYGSFSTGDMIDVDIQFYYYKENDQYSYEIVASGSYGISGLSRVKIFTKEGSLSRLPDSTWKNIDYEEMLTALKVKGLSGLPSGTSAIFTIESEAPPSLTRVLSSSPLISYWECEPPEELAERARQAQRERPGVWSFSLAPRELEEPHSPLAHIDSLRLEVTEAAELGWITDEAVAASARDYLTLARADIDLGEPEAARGPLNALLALVEEEQDAALSSEAYALLRYNTEYILDRLPNVPAGSALDALSGALVITSDELASGTIVSNGFRLDGRDHDLAGTRSDSAQAYGIATTEPVRDFALANIPADRLGNITGIGAAPSIAVEPAGLDLDSLVAVALAHPDLLTLSGVAPATLGTAGAPVVVYAPDTFSLPAGHRGYGILVADEAVSLIDGAEWYGLIVVRGATPELRVRGTGRVLGGVALTGGPADLRLYDKAAILRSVSALALAQTALNAAP